MARKKTKQPTPSREYKKVKFKTFVNEQGTFEINVPENSKFEYMDKMILKGKWTLK